MTSKENAAVTSELATARANLTIGPAMTRKLTVPAIYIAAIILANVLTNRYGLVPIGFGLTCTAGTFAAGVAIVSRNLTQDAVGRLVVLALMGVGIVLSWFLASPALAVASAAAFTISEVADMSVYTWLRDKGWTLALLAAGAVGAVLDTVVFLRIAGFPIWAALPGQLVVKFGMTVLAVIILGGARAVFREPVRAESA